MRLTELTLRNVRLYPEGTPTVHFDRQKNIVLLVGNNGAGKSTVLDTIATLASSFISQFPQQAQKNFTDTDVRITDDNRQADYLATEATFCSSTKEMHVRRTRKGYGKAPESDIRPLKEHAESLYQAILEGQAETELPIMAYYGTERGQIQAPERKRDFQKVFARWDCYTDALISATNFKRFFMWFDTMEDEERRERMERRDFNFCSPVLQAVRRALADFTGQQFTQPRIEIHPLRFVMNETGSSRQLRLEQMSDGYKIVTALVADIASRMAEANPHMENPLLTHGIVLIDEVDLHLHPTWQRKVVAQLHRTFPNVQFILSTHSPVVVLGATALADIFLLDGCQIRPFAQTPQTASLDVSQLLLSSLFGLDSVRAPQWDALLNRRKELANKTGQLTDDETAELRNISQELGTLAYGDSLEAIRAGQLIMQAAQALQQSHDKD